jgi:hypothetical protein
MENVGGWLLALLIAITLIIIIIFSLLGGNNIYYPSEEEKNNLTVYLNEIGLIYYYSPTCYYCEEQKKFINFSKLENKIDVLGNKNKKIRGTPAFFYKGELLYGMKTYEELKEIYGY